MAEDALSTLDVSWSSPFSDPWRCGPQPERSRFGAACPARCWSPCSSARDRPFRPTLLIELLWGGDDLPRNPSNALQIQISYLRKALASTEPDGASLLETRAGGYSLVVDRSRIDAHRFESTVKHLAPLDTLRSTEELSAALDEVGCRVGALAR